MDQTRSPHPARTETDPDDQRQSERLIQVAAFGALAAGFAALVGALRLPGLRGVLILLAALLIVSGVVSWARAWWKGGILARLLLPISLNLALLVMFFNSALWPGLEVPAQTAMRAAVLAAVGLVIALAARLLPLGAALALVALNAAALALFARYNGWAQPLVLVFPLLWALFGALAWYGRRADSAGRPARTTPPAPNRESLDQTLECWGRAVSLRDSESEEHARRVTALTVRFGERLGMSEPAITHLRRGATLHDIGKMAVPDSILRKPGRLNSDEWDIVRQHPQIGYTMLQNVEELQPALDVVYCHHERWDGSGYPRGLKGEDIPREARIFALADVWDALRTDQPYRAAWSPEAIRTYIAQQSGAQFDPQLVPVFLDMMQGEGA